MNLKLFFICLFLLFGFNASAAELGQLTPEQLESLQQQQHPLIVDIRTAEEWVQTGIIPGSHKLQSFDEQGHFDKDKWLNELKKLQKDNSQPIVLVCRSGHRSGIIGKMLIEKLNMQNIYHLSDGILHWLKTGHEIADTCQSNQTC